MDEKKVILSFSEWEELNKRADSKLLCIKHEGFGYNNGPWYQFLNKEEALEQISTDMNILKQRSDELLKKNETQFREIKELQKNKDISEIEKIKDLSIIAFLKWRKI